LHRRIRTAFRKRQKLAFDGEWLKSQGHLRMPKDTAAMKNNPLFVEDFAAFMPFRIHNDETAAQYKELQANNPHLEIEEKFIFAR